MNVSPLLALSLLLFAPLSQAQVYKCVDANGSITYTNDRSAGRGCQQLSEDLPVSSVPAPPKRAGSPNGSSASGSPASFPRVSPETQRARDDTRRQVLDKELANEETALAEARKTLAEYETRFQGAERRMPTVQNRIQAEQEKIATHQRNIEALQKEIGNLK